MQKGSMTSVKAVQLMQLNLVMRQKKDLKYEK